MTDQIKVLMVDDEKRFRETTRKILEKKGFDIILAENGEQALEKLEQQPDVVVLDIKMPGMDGHETLSRIKKVKPDLPVICSPAMAPSHQPERLWWKGRLIT